jgi:hypothetical protein
MDKDLPVQVAEHLVEVKVDLVELMVYGIVIHRSYLVMEEITEEVQRMAVLVFAVTLEL